MKLKGKKFLESTKYTEWMIKYRMKNEYKIGSARICSKNFMHRMGNEYGLGAWRHWGTYENRELILKYTHNPNLKGIDFGGALGPISPYADIVDIVRRTNYGLTIKTPNLSIYADNSIDYIWSSHALEHTDNMVKILYKMKDILKPNGTILFLLPAYTCRRWRPLVTNTHKYIFCLSDDDATSISIDKLLETIGFSIKKIYYCGDNSIFIHAKKGFEAQKEESPPCKRKVGSSSLPRALKEDKNASN